MPSSNQQPEPMLLDDDDVATQENGPAKDNDGIPYCRVHHCRMKHASSGPKGNPKVYYKCQVPNCKETGQRIKTPIESVVPPTALPCPRCSTEKKPVFCERSKFSTGASVILQCPACLWKSGALAVPQLAAAHYASKQRAIPQEGVGDR